MGKNFDDTHGNFAGCGLGLCCYTFGYKIRVAGVAFSNFISFVLEIFSHHHAATTNLLVPLSLALLLFPSSPLLPARVRILLAVFPSSRKAPSTVENIVVLIDFHYLCLFAIPGTRA